MHQVIMTLALLAPGGMFDGGKVVNPAAEPVVFKKKYEQQVFGPKIPPVRRNDDHLRGLTVEEWLVTHVGNGW